MVSVVSVRFQRKDVAKGSVASIQIKAEAQKQLLVDNLFEEFHPKRKANEREKRHAHPQPIPLAKCSNATKFCKRGSSA